MSAALLTYLLPWSDLRGQRMLDIMDAATPSKPSQCQSANARWPVRGAMRNSMVFVAILVVAFIALFHETAFSIVRIWMGSNLFGHGFLIPPIALWLVWKRRKRVYSVCCKPAPLLGLPIIGLMAVAWLLGDVAEVNLVRQFALAGMIPGIVIAVAGREMLRVLVFPLGYLFFAIPFGEFMIAPLQDVTAVFVVKALQVTGIPGLSRWHLFANSDRQLFGR